MWWNMSCVAWMWMDMDKSLVTRRNVLRELFYLFLTFKRHNMHATVYRTKTFSVMLSFSLVVAGSTTHYMSLYILRRHGAHNNNKTTLNVSYRLHCCARSMHTSGITHKHFDTHSPRSHEAYYVMQEEEYKYTIYADDARPHAREKEIDPERNMKKNELREYARGVPLSCCCLPACLHTKILNKKQQ